MLTTIPNATYHQVVTATITFEEADRPNTKAEKRKILPTGFSSGSNQRRRFMFQPGYRSPYRPCNTQNFCIFYNRRNDLIMYLCEHLT
jgi:hypothetical protein